MKSIAAAAQPLAIAGWSQFLAGAVLLPLVPFAPPPGAFTIVVVANVLRSRARVQRDRVPALLPADRGRRPDARDDRDVPDARVRHAVGRAAALGETITLAMIGGCALIVGGTLAVLRPAR